MPRLPAAIATVAPGLIAPSSAASCDCSAPREIVQASAIEPLPDFEELGPPHVALKYRDHSVLRRSTSAPEWNIPSLLMVLLRKNTNFEKTACSAVQERYKGPFCRTNNCTSVLPLSACIKTELSL